MNLVKVYYKSKLKWEELYVVINIIIWRIIGYNAYVYFGHWATSWAFSNSTLRNRICLPKQVQSSYSVASLLRATLQHWRERAVLTGLDSLSKSTVSNRQEGKKFQWNYVETTIERKAHSIACGVQIHHQLLEISKRRPQWVGGKQRMKSPTSRTTRLMDKLRGPYRKSWATFFCMRTGNSRRRRVRL